jgi:hypothetical protein
MPELSRPSIELTITVCHPELCVTAAWTAGDEISKACAASFFRRASGTAIR